MGYLSSILTKDIDNCCLREDRFISCGVNYGPIVFNDILSPVEMLDILGNNHRGLYKAGNFTVDFPSRLVDKLL